jgi:AP2 domain
MQANNTSGFKGVSWETRRGKWQAYIHVDDRLLWLGFYDTRAAAHDVRWAAEMVLHPFRPKPEPIDPLTLVPDGVAISGV